MARESYPVEVWHDNIVTLITTARECYPLRFTHGLQWYPNARAWAVATAVEYGLTVSQVADVISLLSPQKAWLQNLAEARAFIAAYTGGVNILDVNVVFVDHKRPFCTMQQRSKLVGILGLGIALPGRKVVDFRQTILNPWHDGPVIDSWAVKAAQNDPHDAGVVKSDAQYAAYQDAYRLAAAELGLLVSECQAIAWVQFRCEHAENPIVIAELVGLGLIAQPAAA